MTARAGTKAAICRRYGYARRKPAPVRLCGVPGCGHLHAGRGLCNKHLQRRRAREAKGVIHASFCACAECLAMQAAGERAREMVNRAIKAAMP